MIQKLGKQDRISLAMDVLRNGGTVKLAAKRFGISRDTVRKAANRNRVDYSRDTVKPEYGAACHGVDGKKEVIIAAFARLCDSADWSDSKTPTGDAFDRATAEIGRDARELWRERWRSLFHKIKRRYRELDTKFSEAFIQRLTPSIRSLSHYALAAMETNGAIEDGEIAEREIWGGVAAQFQIEPEPEPITEEIEDGQAGD